MGRALVLVLAVLAVSLLRPQWFRPRPAPDAAARPDMQQIGAALETYRHDVGRYPTTFQGLGALTRRPQDIASDSDWYGPYVTTAMPSDPWGHAYQYRDSDGTFRLWSNGADGEPGGTGIDADIVLGERESGR